MWVLKCKFSSLNFVKNSGVSLTQIGTKKPAKIGAQLGKIGLTLVKISKSAEVGSKRKFSIHSSQLRHREFTHKRAASSGASSRSIRLCPRSSICSWAPSSRFLALLALAPRPPVRKQGGHTHTIEHLHWADIRGQRMSTNISPNRRTSAQTYLGGHHKPVTLTPVIRIFCIFRVFVSAFSAFFSFCRISSDP